MRTVYMWFDTALGAFKQGEGIRFEHNTSFPWQHRVIASVTGAHDDGG
ncbi:MAG: hypothetical protein LBV02_06745 [Bacteroidales bacterium]|nr:hypothetical protein [Bacteroidales bacterium]